MILMFYIKASSTAHNNNNSNILIFVFPIHGALLTYIKVHIDQGSQFAAILHCYTTKEAGADNPGCLKARFIIRMRAQVFKSTNTLAGGPGVSRCSHRSSLAGFGGEGRAKDAAISTQSK